MTKIFTALAFLSLLTSACSDGSGPIDPFIMLDAGEDSGFDAGLDASEDAGNDAGLDAGEDSGLDAGIDAGKDSGLDAGMDASEDASVFYRMDFGGVVPIGVGSICAVTIDGVYTPSIRFPPCAEGLFCGEPDTSCVLSGVPTDGGHRTETCSSYCERIR